MLFRRFQKQSPAAEMPQTGEAGAIHPADTDGGHMRADVVHHQSASHPDGVFLLSYYEKKKEEHGMPRRRDLPCRELAPIMPNLFIMAPVTPQADDWAIRLAGQDIVGRLGLEPKGRAISEFLTAEQTVHHAQVYRDVAAGRRLSITTGRIKGLHRDHVSMEFVHVPLLGPDEQSLWILGGVFFGDTIRVSA
jgi:hypothetical protein